MGFFAALWSLFCSFLYCMFFLWMPVGAKITSRILPPLFSAYYLHLAFTLTTYDPLLNYAIWLGITAVLLVPITFLPRTKCASYFLVAFFSMFMVCRRVTDKVIPIFFKSFQVNGWVVAIMWLLCLMMAIGTALEGRSPKDITPKPMKILDRVAASLMNGISLLLPITLLTDKMWIFLLSALGGAVLMYVADVLQFQAFLDYVEPVEPEKERKPLPPAVKKAGKIAIFPVKLAIGLVGGTLRLAGNLIGVDVPTPEMHMFDHEDEAVKRLNEMNELSYEAEKRALAEDRRLQEDADRARKYYNDTY